MISVNQALSQIALTPVQPGEPITLPLHSAVGYTLAAEMRSPINMPPFRQSAMDGYAVNLHDSPIYTLVGEIQAGGANTVTLSPGQAVRIFTGAPVPDSATAIVMQEHVERKENTLEVQKPIAPMDHIRPLGEQIKSGAVALPKGTELTAAGISFLAGLGLVSVNVYPKPSVGVIVSGNELTQPGEPLGPGQIYESNSTALCGALHKMGIGSTTLYQVRDDEAATVATISKALDAHQVVLISGGISVGDYDFVSKALNQLGVQQQFYKVAQKPGKPLFYGTHKNAHVFALPGNPAAAMTCFYVYAYPLLQRITGGCGAGMHSVTAVTSNAFNKKGPRTQFLKAHYANGSVEILDGQASSMMHTMALANAIVVVPAELNRIEAGSSVQISLLP